MNIGNRIKQIRNILNLNQKDFAENIGIGQAALSAIEKEIRNITDRNINLICEKYNVNENWLRNGDGNIFLEIDRDEAIVDWASQITRSDFNNPFIPKFAEMLTKLDENDWKTLEKMTKFLYEKQQKKD